MGDVFAILASYFCPFLYNIRIMNIEHCTFTPLFFSVSGVWVRSVQCFISTKPNVLQSKLVRGMKRLFPPYGVMHACVFVHVRELKCKHYPLHVDVAQILVYTN